MPPPFLIVCRRGRLSFHETGTAEDAQETTNAAVADIVPADNVSTAEDAPDVPAVPDSLSGCPARRRIYII